MPEAVLGVQEFEYGDEVVTRGEDEAYRRYVYEALQESKKKSQDPNVKFTDIRVVMSRIFEEIGERGLCQVSWL